VRRQASWPGISTAAADRRDGAAPGDDRRAGDRVDELGAARNPPSDRRGAGAAGAELPRGVHDKVGPDCRRGLRADRGGGAAASSSSSACMAWIKASRDDKPSGCRRGRRADGRGVAASSSSMAGASTSRCSMGGMRASTMAIRSGRCFRSE